MTIISQEAFVKEIKQLIKVIAHLQIGKGSPKEGGTNNVHELLLEFHHLFNKLKKYTLNKNQKEALDLVLLKLPGGFHVKASTAYEKAIQQAYILLTQVLSTGVHFLTSTLETRRELNEQYQNARKKLLSHIAVLPKQEQQDILDFMKNISTSTGTLSTEQIEAIRKVVIEQLHSFPNLTLESALLALPEATKNKILAIAGSSQDTKQLALLPVDKKSLILAELAKTLLNDNNGTSGALSLVGAHAGISGLLHGTKPYIVILSLVNGVPQIVVINAAQLVKKPEDMLCELVKAMHESGVDSDQVIIRVCSAQEVAALLQLRGTSVKGQTLADLTDEVLEHNTNPEKLSEIMGENVTVQKLFDVLGGLDTDDTGLTGDEVFEVIKVIATLPKVREKLGTDIRISTPSVALRPDGTLIDLTIERLQFDGLMMDLKSIKRNLSKHNGNSNYKMALSAADEVISRFKKAGEVFFNGPSAEKYKAFDKECRSALDNASKELKKERGWYGVHASLRGILGALAMLLIIPAVVFACTKQGYSDTFFGKYHKTGSGVLLGQVESKFAEISASSRKTSCPQ